MPLRRMVRPGDRVIVAFLGATVRGEVEHVNEQQRRLEVLTDEGDTIMFALSRATGQFVAEDASGARLVFPESR
jgi:hypothetical protein